MKKEEFQNSICNALVTMGYKEATRLNGQPYSGKEMYFIPQAPEHYLLTITPVFIELRKMGDNAFRARLTTKVNNAQDLIAMHDEINRIVYKSDHSTLVDEQTGCMATILFFLIPLGMLFYLLL